MSSRTTEPQGPILEPWRIVALALIVAAGLLFVRLIDPDDAAAHPAEAVPVSSPAGAR
ncbi:hypothetical protein SAMN05216360_114185 [Methylobacterium phyllostachyos]|uniref:Uncharacterized protein n=1 Tax=Methylobacterium phyllostachyos TaxID=582672 RepID=A0A1H0GQR6_9HYPH|nr:hypothetical protein [Methylobacterium phyllostachyos]SDO09198.1 hypothetical protein SAMN05216360_114185 [Methylobacterium phyllostachyos]